MNDEVTETKPAVAEVKADGPKKSTIREYFESFAVTLVMAIFGMTSILQAVTVPTGSMQNTILVGDYLLVNKFIFTPGGGSLPFLPQREIERGDIIVFKYPGNKLCPDNDKAHGSSAIQYQDGRNGRVSRQSGFYQRQTSAGTSYDRRRPGQHFGPYSLRVRRAASRRELQCVLQQGSNGRDKRRSNAAPNIGESL
jgi:signal peptidase I